jgi:hypothetical protein
MTSRGPWAVLKRVWTAPASLIGLVLAPFFARRSVTRGVLLCEGARSPRRLGWRYRAIAFGHVVLSVDELDSKTLDHELAHVAQYERWGVFLPPAYAVASLWAWSRGQHHYPENLFEVAARRKTEE